MMRVWGLILLACLSGGARAEDAKPVAAEVESPASNFIEPLEKWHVRVAPETHIYQLTLSGGKELNFLPNTPSLMVYSVNYAGIGGLSYGVHQNLAPEDAVKGSSRYEDWRFNFPFRRFNVFLIYSRYSGFYLQNTDAVGGAGSAKYQLFPDLYAQHLGAHFTWVLDPKCFSLAAMMDQTERQVVSGGSYIVGLSATETVFHNSTGPFIPAAVKSSYLGDGDMYEGRVRTLSARGGGGYTWVFFANRKWTASLLGTLGVGPQQLTIRMPGHSYSNFRVYLNQVDVFANAGYNGERWYSGLSIFYSQSSYFGDTAHFSSQIETGGLYLGTRF